MIKFQVQHPFQDAEGLWDHRTLTIEGEWQDASFDYEDGSGVRTEKREEFRVISCYDENNNDVPFWDDENLRTLIGEGASANKNQETEDYVEHYE